MSKLNGFLAKVGNVVKNSGGDILGIGAKIATGNIGGAIADVTNLLHKENTPQARELLDELEIRRSEFEKEMFALEVKDRESARDMYKSDSDMADSIANKIINLNLWLLLVLVAIQVLVIMFVEGQVAAVVTGIVGTITGALINERNTVVNFFFGSSKGSKDKDK